MSEATKSIGRFQILRELEHGAQSVYDPQLQREVAIKTFVLFPLTIKGKPVALIYAERDAAGSLVIPEKELALLKTLRNQALLAIKCSI